MNIDLALSVLLALASRAGEISALIAKMKAENRTDMTADEIRTVLASDDVARSALVDEIAKAKSEGR